VRTRTLIPLILALAGLPTLSAQSPAPLTLSEAVEMALDHSPERRIAASDVAAARVAAQSARLPLLPTLGFDETITRGNDPVYVFGSLLRQQRFTTADFALNSLNRPLPLNNFATRFSGNWLAFDSFQTELGMRSADHAARAAVAIATRADQQLAWQVAGAYLGVLLAQRQEQLTAKQVQTAQALFDASQSRVEAGTTVTADALSAATALAARKEEQIAAEGALATAWAQLEQAIGKPVPESERNLLPLAENTYTPPALPEAISQALHARKDRQALIEQLASARTGVTAARAAFGPTVGAFGSWEQDRDAFTGNSGNNWLAGVQVHMDLFPAARRQQLAAAKIALTRTQAASQSADDEIRMQVTRAWYAHRTASRQLEVTRAAIAQATESLRILRDRYDAGLATMTDLLRVEDAERQAQNAYWQAVSGNALTWVDLQFAMGTLDPLTHALDLTAPQQISKLSSHEAQP
jgi:outer membrane protein TolC